jgi:hypothetical protein
LVGEEELRGLEGVEFEEGGGEVGEGGAAGGGGTACDEVADEFCEGEEPFGVWWYDLPWLVSMVWEMLLSRERGMGWLTSGSRRGKRFARKLSSVTASVPLKEETRLLMVLSILDLSLALSGVTVIALSHAWSRASSARGCEGATSVRGDKSSIAVKTAAPSGWLTRLSSVSSASLVVSPELINQS